MSKKTLSRNATELAGNPDSGAFKRALAAAQRAVANRGRGGPVVNPPSVSHVPWRVKKQARVTGPLMGATMGRADALPTQVPDGAHVLPADVVSALGDGNSTAGHAKLVNMFPGAGKAGHPFGNRGKRVNFAAGGRAPVDVNLSDGEFVVDPSHVMNLGGGDPERGHQMLDAFILHVRKNYQKHLDNLPGPAQ